MRPGDVSPVLRWYFARRRSPGQMIVLMAFFMIVFLVLVGTAVDYGLILREEQQLQNAIDAAALAGARGMIFAPTPGIPAAQATAAAYLRLYGYEQGDLYNTNIVYAFTTPTAGPTPRPLDSMQITVSRTKPTVFWRIVGINQTTFSQTARARPGQGQLFDVVIAFDETASMSSADIDQLRQAVVKAINDLAPNPSNPRSPKIALAQFQGQVCPATNGVVAFGANGSHQLGDGTNQDRDFPVQVQGQGSGVSAISAGGRHNLLLRSSGTNRVRVWGDNDNLQSASGTPSLDVDPPATVSIGGSNVETHVAAGGSHSMVVEQPTSGPNRLWTWGANGRGQLGRDTGGADSATPGLTSLTGISAIAAGRNHGVVLLNSGTNFGRVRTFGDDTDGQLGNGGGDDTGPTIRIPSNVAGNVTVTRIAAGRNFTIAAGTETIGANSYLRVWGWGRNDHGQLGNGAGIPGASQSAPVAAVGGGSALPTNTPGLTVAQISAGEAHVLALLSDGRVYSWGANSSGQLGRNGTTDSSTPGEVIFPGLLGQIVEVAAGSNHSLARDSNGQLWVWGGNQVGQLGDGSATSEPNGTPFINLNVVNASKISAGGTGTNGHSLVISCSAVRMDAHVLTNLTADPAVLHKIATNVPAAPPCPTLPPQPANATAPGGPTTYGCPLRAVGGSGTYIKDAFDIALNTSLNPPWNLYDSAKGGRPESKKYLIVMTDGQNNQLSEVNLTEPVADQRTVLAAERLKRGLDGVAGNPCLQTSVPPCDDITVYTVGFFDGAESAWDGPPRMCGPDKAAQGGAVIANLPPPTNVDAMLLAASSSTPGLCDKYIPLAKSDSLPKVFEVIVADILRGQLLN